MLACTNNGHVISTISAHHSSLFHCCFRRSSSASSLALLSSLRFLCLRSTFRRFLRFRRLLSSPDSDEDSSSDDSFRRHREGLLLCLLLFFLFLDRSRSLDESPKLSLSSDVTSSRNSCLLGLALLLLDSTDGSSTSFSSLLLSCTSISTILPPSGSWRSSSSARRFLPPFRPK